ncbi:hypothetical protein ABG067_000660 [Albugo candida]
MEAIVIDNGSGVMKAGFASEDLPQSLFPSCILSDNRTEVTTSPLKQHSKYSVIGSKCQQHREIVATNYPIERGIVKDWDALEKIWRHTFVQQLRVNPERSALPILSCLSPSDDFAKQQGRMAQILFETYRVSGFYTMNQCSLSLFASGRTRGIVLEIGHGSSHAVPIFEGYALPHASVHYDIGGIDISKRLKILLAQDGHSVDALHPQTLDSIKESSCFMQSKAQNERDEITSSIPFELPDGTELLIDNETLCKPSRVLFEPKELQSECSLKCTKGIHQAVLDSIAMCDEDLRGNLRQAVLLAGGTTMIKGYSRIQEELQSNCNEKLSVVPDAQFRERGYNTHRKIAAWIGGSILASLSTFRDMHISKQEWEEHHEAILHRKCFF